MRSRSAECATVCLFVGIAACICVQAAAGDRVLTGTVLVIVLVTKFASGAWIALLLMVVLFVTMRGISRHYAAVAEELAGSDWDAVLPSRTRCVDEPSHANGV